MLPVLVFRLLAIAIATMGWPSISDGPLYMIPDFMVYTPIFETFYNKIKQLSNAITCGLRPAPLWLSPPAACGPAIQETTCERRLFAGA